MFAQDTSLQTLTNSFITCSLAIALPLKYGELDNEYKLEHREPVKTGGDRGENTYFRPPVVVAVINCKGICLMETPNLKV